MSLYLLSSSGSCSPDEKEKTFGAYENYRIADAILVHWFITLQTHAVRLSARRSVMTFTTNACIEQLII